MRAFKVKSSTKLNGTSTGHATDPSTQWKYTVNLCLKNDKGYAGFTVPDWATDQDAFNFAEYINTTITASSPNQIMGNGVTLKNLDYNGDGTYEFFPRPIPDNSIVFCVGIPALNDDPELWIVGMPNGIDGKCA